MDRNALEPLSGETRQETAELSRAPDGAHASNRDAAEGVEHAPVPRAHREPASIEVRLERCQDVSDEPVVSSFQVEHELGRGRRRGEQLRKPKPRVPRGDDLPAIPEERKRSDGLQVADLEPPAVEADVGFDERLAEAFSCPQVCEPVAGAMRDEKRVSPAYERSRSGRRTHYHRV